MFPPYEPPFAAVPLRRLLGIRSKNMLTIISNALQAVKGDPEYLGSPRSLVTYHTYLNLAIRAIGRILWGYTARDRVEIVLPEKPILCSLTKAV